MANLAGTHEVGVLRPPALPGFDERRPTPVVPYSEEIGDPNSCLIRLHPLDPSIGPLRLGDGEFVLGRDAQCDLVLADSSISRRHAVILPPESNGRRRLVDLHSTNGTHVNDQPVQEAILQTGDLIRIGTFILKYLAGAHFERQYHEAVFSMVVRDPLTGLWNRRYLIDALDREAYRARRHGRPLGLVLFDIDHFKRINDRHGHLAGDSVLRDLAHRLAPVVGRDELLARYGGEEFCVLLPEATAHETYQYAERLRRRIGEEPFRIHHLTLTVTVSVGFAHTTRGTMSATELLNLADRQMYTAKDSGRDRVHGEEVIAAEGSSARG